MCLTEDRELIARLIASSVPATKTCKPSSRCASLSSSLPSSSASLPWSFDAIKRPPRWHEDPDPDWQPLVEGGLS